MPGAVRPFERLRSRLRPARIYGVNTPNKKSVTSAEFGEQWRMLGPTDLIFPKWQRELFKTILGEEQIQFLLGHVSVQTTERYLGCKQRIQSAVNDRIGIEAQL